MTFKWIFCILLDNPVVFNVDSLTAHFDYLLFPDAYPSTTGRHKLEILVPVNPVTATETVINVTL